MTIEIERTLHGTFLSKSQEASSTDNNFNSSTENIENVSPPANVPELMVAIKPSILPNAQIIKAKISIPAVTKRINEHILLQKNLVSPIKRPLVNNITEAPLPKKISTPSYSSQSAPNSPNRLLSQSAGQNSELQATIKKVQANLSQSCFADLRTSKDIDNELTCLNWLQEGNLLNGFAPGKKEDQKNDDKESEDNPTGTQDSSDLNLLVSDPLNSINEVDKSLRKPAYSFSTLIFMAIENAKDKRLPVKEIYQWIQDNFPYFQKAPIGWKNSVRHNLSLNKSFKKVDKEKV